MTQLRVVPLVMLLWMGAASVVRAQVPVPVPVRPPARPVTVPARGDTLRTRADSLRARLDTTARRDSLATPAFAAPDSVMQRLLSTPGYTVTRYQGEIITFDALTRAFQLTEKAIAQRDSQLVKSDTISYSGSGSSIRVGTEIGRAHV